MSAAQVICLTPPDLTLVDRCRRNDTAAFDEVVGRYKNKVYNYVYRMVGNSDDAEDLTQEVFVRMYTSLDSFRRQASLHTWLFRIASNLCIDHFRRSKKSRGAPIRWTSRSGTAGTAGKGGGHEIADAKYEPHRLMEQREMAEQIQQALGQLPEKLRAGPDPSRHRGPALRRDRTGRRLPAGDGEVPPVPCAPAAAPAAFRVCSGLTGAGHGMKMMTCKTIQPLLVEYSDGLLDTGRRARRGVAPGRVRGLRAAGAARWRTRAACCARCRRSGRPPSLRRGWRRGWPRCAARAARELGGTGVAASLRHAAARPAPGAGPVRRRGGRRRSRALSRPSRPPPAPPPVASESSLVSQCVAQHQSDVAAQPLSDPAAQNLAAHLSGATAISPPDAGVVEDNL